MKKVKRVKGEKVKRMKRRKGEKVKNKTNIIAPQKSYIHVRMYRPARYDNREDRHTRTCIYTHGIAMETAAVTPTPSTIDGHLQRPNLMKLLLLFIKRTYIHNAYQHSKTETKPQVGKSKKHVFSKWGKHLRD